MVLVLKVVGDNSMDKFRPISLCNYFYKIISKVLTSRFLKILPMIISLQQSGFSPGKKIFDSISLVHEVIHSLMSTNKEIFLLNLNLSKAYDRVDLNLHL